MAAGRRASGTGGAGFPILGRAGEEARGSPGQSALQPGHPELPACCCRPRPSPALGASGFPPLRLSTHGTVRGPSPHQAALASPGAQLSRGSASLDEWGLKRAMVTNSSASPEMGCVLSVGLPVLKPRRSWGNRTASRPHSGQPQAHLLKTRSPDPAGLQAGSPEPVLQATLTRSDI